MAKNDLLKEAIADAKAVRETALANAKIALEEAFTPRIQSMLSAKLSEEEEAEMSEEEAMDEPTANEARGDKEVDETKEEELEEAYNVIRFLKSKINEVNLLNAKLLFSNKLFRNHSLNENQKMKVIENFDRAQSLREVKLVFATLSESFGFGVKTKRTIKESYASKSTRSTAPSKKVISEGSDLSARWKKLANL
jgi:predicted  nucleic acid-binding Zn-ribbon protein